MRRARRPPTKAEKEELHEQRQELDEQQSPELAMQDGSSGVQQLAGKLGIGISGPEALSSDGRHPAGTATAEDRQADDKAEPSKASVFIRAGYAAADLISGGHTAADLKRLGYSEAEMPASSRRPGISNPKRPNTCSGSSCSDAAASRADAEPSSISSAAQPASAKRPRGIREAIAVL